MLDCFLSPELNCDVPAWREVVGVDGAITEHGVETLKDFRGHCNERSELNGVEVDVCEQVVFDLCHNFRRINLRDSIEHICYGNFKVILNVHLRKERADKQCKYPILGEVSNFGDPQQRRQFSDRFPRGKLVLSDKIVQVEDSGLDDCFELPPN